MSVKKKKRDVKSEETILKIDKSFEQAIKATMISANKKMEQKKIKI